MKVSWIYHLSREDLLAEVEVRGLRRLGSVAVLRQRLVEEIRGCPYPKLMASGGAGLERGDLSNRLPETRIPYSPQPV